MDAFRFRVKLAGALLGLFALAVFARLVTIQVVHREEYSRKSRQQTVQRRVVRATRGRILDSRGRELAVSVGGDASEARQEARVYPNGELAGPLLGYVGRDGYGLGGAELAFERYLRGEDGWTLVHRDARITKGGQRNYNVDLPEKPAVRGADVHLTIDLEIQKILQSILQQTLERYRAQGAMGVVVDPSTGAILAMANEPSFDPNRSQEYPLAQRVNRCIGGIYEPGSTYKLVTASAALQERVLAESDTLFAGNGVYTVYGESIRDHKPFGIITFADAVAQSSNVFFARLADRLGNERFYRYTCDFGFGERTGIALPGEEAGIVHPVREWSGRTRVTMAMGHELCATLLQVVMLYAAVANDGVLVQPMICNRVVDAGGEGIDTSTVRPVRRVVSRDVARRLRVMLRQVVQDGTGTLANVDGVEIAGKTGTSQKLDLQTRAYMADRYVTSFVGMVPAEEPALVCGIVVDDPDTARAGGLSAAPAFRQVVRQLVSNPDLRYAERILSDSSRQSLQRTPSAQATVPAVCGMSVGEAREKLQALGVLFDVIGTADTVRYQSPAWGRLPSTGMRVKLYADESVRVGGVDAPRVAVPDCRGADLREAISMLNVRGIMPYVIGAGVVRGQRPGAGALLRQAEPCSLFCSYGS
jgi:cell division protein FtsI (penicillin-binding protein 3)